MAQVSRSWAVLSRADVFGELGRNWLWLLVLGIFSAILGVVGLGMTFFLTLASVLYFGVLMIIGGVVQIVHAVKCSGWKSVISHVLIGLLYVVAGFMIVARPLLASVVLTWTLAGILIAVGVLRLVMAIQHRAMQGWTWTFLAGVATVLLGLMILARWPTDALWVIGLFLAVELIINGVTAIFVALAARVAGQSKAMPRRAASVSRT